MAIHKCYSSTLMVPGEGYIFEFYISPQNVDNIQQVLSNLGDMIDQAISPHKVRSVSYEPATHIATVIVEAKQADQCHAVDQKVQQTLANATGGPVNEVGQALTLNSLDWKALALVGGALFLGVTLMRHH